MDCTSALKVAQVLWLIKFLLIAGYLAAIVAVRFINSIKEKSCDSLMAVLTGECARLMHKGLEAVL